MVIKKIKKKLNFDQIGKTKNSSPSQFHEPIIPSLYSPNKTLLILSFTGVFFGTETSQHRNG